MAGPYIHMSAMRHAAADLAGGKFTVVGSDHINPDWPGVDLVELGKLMQAKPNYAAIGAIGPDLFFFLPDFRDYKGVQISSVLIKVLEFIEHVYEIIDPYISKYEHYLGPISENEAEQMSCLTGGLSEIVGNITGELASILITVLEDFVVQQKDWWSFFALGLNQGFDEQAFLWSDMLHYRKTGQFGQKIWDRTSEDAGEIAYALGYITHLATDVTSHALVNTIAGGPFRHHWQRHHLVENHMDAYWYRLDPDPSAPRQTTGYRQFTESAVYFDIAFKEGGDDPVPRPKFPGGETLRDNYIRRRVLDIDSELPDNIAQLLVDTIEEVFYQHGNHPKILRDSDGRATPELIQEAYRLLFRFLKLTTVDGFSHEPPDPPDVFPNLDFPTFSDPAGDDAPGDDDGGSFWNDLLDFILSVVKVLAYIVEVAIYLATLPWAVLADLVTYPFRLGLYYSLELPLSHLLKNFRSVLVMSGYLMPMADEIAQPLIRVGNTEGTSWALLRGELGDVFGGLLGEVHTEEEVTFQDKNYPYMHPVDEFRRPWQYPPKDTPPEFPKTTAGPHARNAGPPVLFSPVPATSEIRDALELAPSPKAADEIGDQLMPFRHMGDAVNFSKYLIWLASRNDNAAQIVDWNLDADRGYGYHCWDFDRHIERDPDQKDPEGNRFKEPCTWPSQADPDLDPAAPRRDPKQPIEVKTHWDSKEDPGCGSPPIV